MTITVGTHCEEPCRKGNLCTKNAVEEDAGVCLGMRRATRWEAHQTRYTSEDILKHRLDRYTEVGIPVFTSHRDEGETVEIAFEYRGKPD